MTALVAVHQAGCLHLIRGLLWLAVVVDEHRRRFARRLRRTERAVRRLYRRWLVRERLHRPPPYRRRRPPWNRTPDHIEEQVVRLHVEQPHLGAGQLRWLVARVIGFSAARETIRQILIRRRDLVVALEGRRRRGSARHRPPRIPRIHVAKPRRLWGADLTLVWVLWIVPVWLVGIVDYHGSRLLCLERLRLWPTAAQLAAVLDRTIERFGAPTRLLTDRAPVLRAAEIECLLGRHGTRHVLIKPCHAWTNGRIERVFRTFKETVFDHADLWLFRSTAQVDRYCADFVQLYNRDRPHSAYGGRTPDEVYFGQAAHQQRGRVSYFDGRLRWYRFG
jgi:putative transposase